MKKQALTCIARMTATAALLAALAATGAVAAATQILDVRIGAGPDRVDGTLDSPTHPFFLDVIVTGHGISSAQVTTPMQCTFPMEQVGPTTWTWEIGGFSSLAEMRNDPCLGYGAFLLEFTDRDGGEDTVTLQFDPGDGSPFWGYGEVTAPEHQDFDVGLDPEFQWICAGTCSPGELWTISVVDETDGTWRRYEDLPPGRRVWQVGPLAPGRPHGFRVLAVQFLGGSQETTQGGDDFDYDPVYRQRNKIQFTARDRIDLVLDRGSLSWTPGSGATGYDVVRGDLGTLRSGGGDHTVATTECVADDHAETSLAYGNEPVLPGEGFWFLVRPESLAEGFESLAASQVQGRTPEVDAAAATCPPTPYLCPPDVPSFYAPSNLIASGVCVEAYGKAGPSVCPESDYLRSDADMTAIKAAYPWTEAIEDPFQGAGQAWSVSPFQLLCFSLEDLPENETLFDELDSCYQSTSNCRTTCRNVWPEFPWAVNVRKLVGIPYGDVAAWRGGVCSLDGGVGLPGGATPGFHARDEGNGSWLWTVRSTNQCDSGGCRCDATVEVRTNASSPGVLTQVSLVNESTPECVDPRFSF